MSVEPADIFCGALMVGGNDIRCDLYADHLPTDLHQMGHRAAGGFVQWSDEFTDTAGRPRVLAHSNSNVDPLADYVSLRAPEDWPPLDEERDG